jgi:hypothetical protein
MFSLLHTPSPAHTGWVLFWWDWGLNQGHCPCKAGSLKLDPTPTAHFALVVFEDGVS